jgi:hypothetical protein
MMRAHPLQKIGGLVGERAHFSRWNVQKVLIEGRRIGQASAQSLARFNYGNAAPVSGSEQLYRDQ